MHLLKPFNTALAALVLLTIACSPSGPVTPDDAFVRMKRAMTEANADEVIALLSSGSLKKIETITRSFAAMDSRQIGALSRSLGVSAEQLKRMTPRSYIALQFNIGKSQGKDLFRDMMHYKPVGTDLNGNEATIRLENGISLNLVREGPYWKFDLDRL